MNIKNQGNIPNTNPAEIEKRKGEMQQEQALDKKEERDAGEPSENVDGA